MRIRDGGKKPPGMPCSSSDVAECGDMIRTVLPVLVLVARGMSNCHQQMSSLETGHQLRCPSCEADLYLWAGSELPISLRKHC